MALGREGMGVCQDPHVSGQPTTQAWANSPVEVRMNTRTGKLALWLNVDGHERGRDAQALRRAYKKRAMRMVRREAKAQTRVEAWS